MGKTETVFVTKNLKLAMALTAAGFAIRNGQQIIRDGRPSIICELEPHHNGVDAIDLKACFECPFHGNETRTDLVECQHKDRHDLSAQVNEIIAARGITQEEYVILAFDAARCALHNRSTVLHAINQDRKLIHKDIGNGRSLIYREGTPRSTLQKLVDNA